MAVKKVLPEGLVDLSTAHCPIIEPTQFGLPYHGLVVNGKLQLPNGKYIDYRQPRALEHKTVTYYVKGGYWCENNGGFYAPDGYQVTKYVRKYFGSTILVKGAKAKIPERSKIEREEDYKNGVQWKNYAYLSGTLKQIGSYELELGVLNDYGDGIDNKNTVRYVNKEVSVIAKMYNKGYWLYNDGNVTWLMGWIINPSTTTTIVIGPSQKIVDPVRILTIYVIKPFGVFGVDGASKMTPRKIFEGPYDVDVSSRSTNSGYPCWLPFYSSDGSKVSINEFWNWFYYGCSDIYQKYWIAQLVRTQTLYDIQMCDLNPSTGYWSSDSGQVWSWCEINITGKGSLNKNNFAEGIQVNFTPKYYGRDWVPPDYGNFEWWGCLLCACVNPNGDRGYWWMEDWDPLSGEGNLKSTWGHKIPYNYMNGVSGVDLSPCYQGIEAPYFYIQQGVELLDNGTMVLCWTGSKSDDFTTVHLQTGSYCKGGISYDIANDKWSILDNSCYV